MRVRTTEDAQRYGKNNYALDGEPFFLVEARVSKTFADTLERFGPDSMTAVSVSPEKLGALNSISRITRHISAPVP